MQQYTPPFPTGPAHSPSLAASMAPHSQVAHSIRAPSRGPMLATHSDKARRDRQAANWSEKFLQFLAPPQDSSTDPSGDNNRRKGIIVDGFPSSWKLSRIKEYLSQQGILPFTVQPSEQPRTKVSFLTRQAALNAIDDINLMSVCVKSASFNSSSLTIYRLMDRDCRLGRMAPGSRRLFWTRSYRPSTRQLYPMSYRPFARPSVAVECRVLGVSRSMHTLPHMQHLTTTQQLESPRL